MKKINLLILFLVGGFASGYGQTTTDTTGDYQVNILLSKLANKTITTNERRELTKLTYSIQNKGFELDEMKQDYAGALEQTDKALDIWILLKDTMKEANIRKYKGYLLGRLGKFSEAKAEINLSIELFKTINETNGVAVAQFDLSKVYEFENKFDFATIYAELALSHWHLQNDTFRILTVNNQLMNLHYLMGTETKSKDIQKESELLLQKKDLHWRPIIDFYVLSYQLYEKLKNKGLAFHYKKLYADQIDSLKQQNIITTSTYEIK